MIMNCRRGRRRKPRLAKRDTREDVSYLALRKSGWDSGEGEKIIKTYNHYEDCRLGWFVAGSLWVCIPSLV